MSTRKVFSLATLVLFLFALWLVYRFDVFRSADYSSALVAPNANGALQNTAGTRNTNNNSLAIVRTTKQTGNSLAPWRQLTLTKSELESNPKFWMLAYSAQDMAWLDRFGYPTLAEEAQLEKASAEDLRAMAEAGDLRARVHLGLRFAESAMKNGDPKTFETARLEISQALITGGPYEAAKTATFFVDLANNRKLLGELGPTQLKGLQNDLLQYYEMARGLSAAYGDFAAVRAFNAQYDIGPLFGLPPEQPSSFQASMSQLANMNKARINQGLLAMSFEQRPSPTGPPGILNFQPSNTVYAR